MKYVLVTGGVVSGLGKGVTASSIGVILQACGHRVTSIKIGACGVWGEGACARVSFGGVRVRAVRAVLWGRARSFAFRSAPADAARAAPGCL